MRAIPILVACAIGAGCAVGSIGGGGSDPDAEEGAQPVEKVVPKIGLRRLTSYEYDNVLRDLLGEPSRKSALVLPEDPRTPFDNDVAKQAVSKALVEGIELLARDAAKSVLADPARRDKVVGCTPTGPKDDACFDKFVRTFGRKALRRPLEDEEISKLEALSSFGVEANDFYAGVETVLLALLQHEELVYRVEIGSPIEGRPSVTRLNDFELASRLSFFIWASTPDDELLDAAQGGALADDAGLRAQAARMLADPKAKETVNRFHAMWLGYDKVLATTDLSKDMIQESEALIQRTIFDRKEPWQNIFTSTETYATDSLAAHYGLKGSGSSTPQWIPYADSGRKGILSHGLFLTNGAKLDDTSPTLRGKAIRLRLMCQDIPPPPKNVNTDLPPLKEGQCKSDRLAAHSTGGCAACHGKMDPIGLGLEKFDQAGRYRTTEPGKPECVISGDGNLDPVGKFNGPAELADLMLKDGAVQSCMATQMFRYATGKSTLDDDDSRFIAWWIEKVGGAKGGFKFDDLLVEFVATEGFRERRQLGGS